MEIPEKIKNKKGQKVENPSAQDDIHALREQLNTYEKEKNILLALSNDITKVREKEDLINLFSSGLNGLFYFTHAVISLIDKQSNTYYPFLINPEAVPIKHQLALPSFFRMRFPMTDPFIKQVLDSDEPVTFWLEDIIHKPGIPPFIKINYECGIRHAMMTKLKSKMEMIGYVIIYSDHTDPFPDDFRRVLHGIAPHLSNAVTNIIINEEIRQRDRVNGILLSLSNDMVMVRDRTDLLNVINFSLKKLIYFTHSVMTILNETGETYRAFLTDSDFRAWKLPEYGEMVTMPNPVKDGIYDVASRSYKPLVFDMKKFDLNKTPLWFKLNYQAGAKEMLIKVLRGGETPKHSIILFSDKANNFDQKVIDIIERISSQLATAINNISANEEILEKEQDKTLLLNFSHEIAAVRTKEDLANAIRNSLKKLSVMEVYIIRTINEDGNTLSPFIYSDETVLKDSPAMQKLHNTKIKISEGITGKVMNGNVPVLIDFEEEVRQGNTDEYIELWKQLGAKKAAFQKMVGTPLRVGNIDLGILWVLTVKINMTILEGICAQISVAISNILANEQVLAYKQMLEVENDHLKEQIKTIYNFSDIIGSGAEMQKVYRMLSLVAESNSTVLLLGETGTGKELIARAIHNSSPRKSKLMVKVNCAALPVNLIESELFGHERGSFTGAIERRVGKFELANNSTIFLDEIGELPVEMQVKLLRAIQEREVERVGGKSSIKVDVRIIAATNRNLEEEVAAGRFRSDLYYRLNVFPIILPPLRNRVEDIAPLAYFFLARYSKNTGRRVTKISNKVIQQLKSYLWPGNVRELEHLIERSILLTDGNALREIELPRIRNAGENNRVNNSSKTLQQSERSYIIEILQRCSGKVSGRGSASELLEIPPTTLHSKLKKLGISKEDYFPQHS